jgi:flagellar hook-associated protein 3 FlgL
MRVTGNSLTTSLIDQLNSLTAQQYRLQNQAATGMRIQAPSDDPTGMQQALDIQAESADVTQFAQNITTLQNRANAAYSAISSLQTISNRIGDIVTGVDGTTSPSAMQANATEVTQLIQQAVQILNAKSGNGYLFGGTASGQPPFSITTDSNGNVTAVTYNGNSDVTESPIDSGTTLSVDVPGQNNTGSGARGLVSDNRYGADFFNHLISLQNDLLAGNSSAVQTTDAPALQKDADNLNFQVANNGAIQARLTAAASQMSSRQNGLQTSLTNVAGADMTQTLVQLNQAQNAYRAALQSSATILQLQSSLLAYLP